MLNYELSLSYDVILSMHNFVSRLLCLCESAARSYLCIVLYLSSFQCVCIELFYDQLNLCSCELKAITLATRI